MFLRTVKRNEIKAVMQKVYFQLKMLANSILTGAISPLFLKQAQSLTFPVVHRRHFGETNYVTRMLTILSPAHFVMHCHVS